jgi:hypothetical protein
MNFHCEFFRCENFRNLEIVDAREFGQAINSYFSASYGRKKAAAGSL